MPLSNDRSQPTISRFFAPAAETQSAHLALQPRVSTEVIVLLSDDSDDDHENNTNRDSEGHTVDTKDMTLVKLSEFHDICKKSAANDVPTSQTPSLSAALLTVSKPGEVDDDDSKLVLTITTQEERPENGPSSLATFNRFAQFAAPVVGERSTSKRTTSIDLSRWIVPERKKPRSHQPQQKQPPSSIATQKCTNKWVRMADLPGAEQKRIVEKWHSMLVTDSTGHDDNNDTVMEDQRFQNLIHCEIRRRETETTWWLLLFVVMDWKW